MLLQQLDQQQEWLRHQQWKLPGSYPLDSNLALLLQLLPVLLLPVLLMLPMLVLVLVLVVVVPVAMPLPMLVLVLGAAVVPVVGPQPPDDVRDGPKMKQRRCSARCASWLRPRGRMEAGRWGLLGVSGPVCVSNPKP